MEKNTRLYDTFVGTFVTIIVKGVKGPTTVSKISNLMFTGYMLDECENFFYIGSSPTSVAAAIRKNDVAAVLAGGPDDALDDESDDIEIPDDALEQ